MFMLKISRLKPLFEKETRGRRRRWLIWTKDKIPNHDKFIFVFITFEYFLCRLYVVIM